MALATPFDLTCLGEPMLELNLQPSNRGAPRVYLEAHGGDASNVAIAAARQGARVAFLSALGDDPAGQSFLDLWQQEGVGAAGVRVDPEHSTGLYFVSHDGTGHHFSYLRRNSAASHYRLDDEARAILRGSRFVFASGISLGISDRAADTVFEATAVAREAGAQVAFDTNYRPKLWPKQRAAALIQQAMRSADIVFPGLEDCATLFDMFDPTIIVDHCLALGPRIVVLKMGQAGALLATPDMRRPIDPFPCHPVDATGAGDTFCGSFLARLAAGDDLKQSACYAACAAALATTGYGAVPPIPRRTTVLQAIGRAS